MAPTFAVLTAASKAGHVDLTEGALVYDGVGVVAEVLRVVAEKVLDGGRDTLLLDAAYVADGDAAGEEGIFAEVFKVAAVHWCTVDVDAGAE